MNSRITQASNGRSPQGRSGIGISAVGAPRRVAAPPVRIAHCRIVATLSA
jgi:hypothetical protein